MDREREKGGERERERGGDDRQDKRGKKHQRLTGIEGGLSKTTRRSSLCMRVSG